MHLQGGYVEFPPVTALLAALARELFGWSLVGLRAFTILASAGTVVVGALIARELGATRRAQTLAAAIIGFSPGMLATNLLFQPVALDQLATLGVLWLALRLALGRGSWPLLGVAVGIGLETKYTLAVVLVLLIGTFLVWRRDVLRSWDDPDNEELLPRTIEWTALTTTRLAVIDHAFAIRAAQWPEVVAALFDRAARRAERLVVMQAIAHLTRVDDRLLALLWSLAERWGRVVPGGVLVSLRLSHRTLAGMVGARRPSVTTALGQLMARGDIERRADGEWILRGDPPESTPSRTVEPVRFERQVRV